jgi:uncharacterized protein YxjI
VRYLVRDRMFAFHEEAWIETEHREKVFKVDRKHLRLRTTFAFVDPWGQQAATIVRKAMTWHHTILIKHDGQHLGKISRRAFKLFGDRFTAKLADGRKLRINGNLWDREFDIQHRGTTLAHVSRRWFSLRDTYAVDVLDPADTTMLLVLAVCVDHILHEQRD